MENRRAILFVCGAASAIVGCTGMAEGGDPPYGPRARVEDAGPRELVAEDTDRDGIVDVHEDAAMRVDTDNDGSPDYVDDDSDGDGIADRVEGRVLVMGGAPADTDGDGTHDFRDLDSDGNGVPDRDEGGDDPDRDGLPSSADPDDDGDFLLDGEEIGMNAAMPRDSDGDHVPDFLDVDSDDDGIGDREEAGDDTDHDMVIDRLDEDSDGDGFSDADEAGDDDVATAAIDTDDDGVADYRDPDSDADGLADERERELGTARGDADSDGDGVTDLVEVLGCEDDACRGDATDAMSSPRARGSFVFLEPFEEAPSPARDTLSFATDLRVADVYFLVDTTGSMSGAIDSLRARLSEPTTGLIDRVRAVIPDVWFGVGEHKDYNAGPYGGGGDFAFRNDLAMSSDSTAAQAASNALSANGGGDGPESQIPALWAVATGNALGGPGGVGAASCASGSGHACWREGAIPIVVLMTDIQFHNGPGGSNAYSTMPDGAVAPTYDETVAALTARGVRVIGISVGQNLDGGGGGGGTDDLRAIARDTGAVDASGAPLVTGWTYGQQISDQVVQQIQTLAEQTPIDVRAEVVDDPSDDVDAIASFIDHVEARAEGDAMRGCLPATTADTDGDGHADAFPGLRPGTRVCFDVIAKENATVMPTSEPQLFRATVRVLGSGSELDTRDVWFLVPPRIVEVMPGLY